MNLRKSEIHQFHYVSDVAVFPAIVARVRQSINNFPSVLLQPFDQSVCE